MKKKVFRSDFLFPKTDFITGMGSIINLVGCYYTFNKTSNPDRNALINDWGVVGQDLHSALIEFIDEEDCAKEIDCIKNDKIEHSY
ncbi:hypothetical protein ACFSQD_11640 [Flavihumibacter stibioxidans]|uniref:Uncharacterized protein n=1 Tax=Flavihumibacter stibioxidans TaxID=1834163 RepID=A0ABR7M9S1_9BACT|nr:hypothetical protein [Flavihumibacter stibioxidans]MBC6491722.1 hypothetical protein [Flavihumibacter stibioxidans]